MELSLLRIEQLIVAVMDGSVELSDALAIGNHWRDATEHEAQVKWIDLRKDPRSNDARAFRLGEFLWQLLGPTKIMRGGFHNVREDIVAHDIIRRHLASDPHTFSDDDLIWVGGCCEDQMLRSAVKQVQAQRLTQIGLQLKQQPAELTGDVRKVQQRVSQYSFNPDLNALLEKVEEGMIAGGDQFDQSALLKHLRTFFEKLHQHAGECLRTRRPELVDGTDLTKCGQAIDYLGRKDVLTAKMKALGNALYGVLSNEGVHAVKTDPEYVRLCRNMVAEYALVLFFELDERLRK